MEHSSVTVPIRIEPKWCLVSSRKRRPCQRANLTPPSSARPKGRFSPFGPSLVANVKQLNMPLQIGDLYTREQIGAEVGGGDVQSYLPHRDGRVLCGCFDPKVNARAPYEIDLGVGRDVIRYARRLLEQDDAVPVFLRREAFAWEYVGRFRAVQYTADPNDLFPAKAFRRRDAIAVLYLTTEPDVSNEEVTEDPAVTTATALEGGVALLSHLGRERNRQLVEAKRRAYRAETGELSCEACGLRAGDLPPQIGEGCFEVHHTLPLAQREAASLTKLDDLALVCANCHRLIHRSTPMLAVHELARLRAAVA